MSPPQAFYCEGKGFALGVVPGRIGANQTGAPYKNKGSWNGSKYCPDQFTVADIPNNKDGYKACNGYNSVVTVWRQ